MFMSEARKQQGVDALGKYYKQQGLSDAEANFRILKAQESIKVTNQAEWVELMATGVATNIIGSKGVTMAEKYVAPRIVGGTTFTSVLSKIPTGIGIAASKLPLVGKWAGPAIKSLATQEGVRYAATRTIGMIPAGAAEAMIFTGAQKQYRYNKEPTKQEYIKAGIIGGLSALGAQTIIERNYPRTATGGVIKPDFSFAPKFERPTKSEALLFVGDPLEPVSDALTTLFGGAKGIKTNTFANTLVNTNINPYTNSFAYMGDTFVTPLSSTNTNLQSYTDTNTNAYPSVVTLTKTPTTEQPFSFSQVQSYVAPKVNSLTRVIKTNTQLPSYVDTTNYAEVFVNNPYTNPVPSTNTNTNPRPSTNPYVNPAVNPEVNPNVNPNVLPEVNPDANVNVINKLPPIFGWYGGFGSGTEGRRSSKGVKEWIIGNKIATYGEDWFAKQQQKTKVAEAAFKHGTSSQFRLAPQGMQVMNRVNRLPTQQFNTQPQFNMPQQQFIMREPQIQYNVEPQNFGIHQKPQETPRQRAQRAVERGFGKIQSLTVEKIRGKHKATKFGSNKIKGWK
jgi:hypothetical protein